MKKVLEKEYRIIIDQYLTINSYKKKKIQIFLMLKEKKKQI